MSDVINVTKREQTGTRFCRRLRESGQIPAVLYGHGKENINLSLPARELHGVIRHGGKMVDIRGDFNESALIREVHWDPFGLEVLHLDLTRVSAGESVEVDVTVELRGEAPGAKEGGVLDQPTHDITISCPARSIPEKLEASINELHLNETITAGQLELPPGASLLSDPDVVIASCAEPVAAVAGEEMAPGEGAEPEVIGRPEEGEEAGGES